MPLDLRAISRSVIWTPSHKSRSPGFVAAATAMIFIVAPVGTVNAETVVLFVECDQCVKVVHSGMSLPLQKLAIS